MSEGGQVRKGGGSERETEEQVDASVETPSEKDSGPQELLDDVDALLDEIDDVLEENAEEFVRGYVQKGGQ